jgi:hypothetical protein
MAKDNTMMYVGLAIGALYLMSRSKAAAPQTMLTSTGQNIQPATPIELPATLVKPVFSTNDNPVPDGWYPDPNSPSGSTLYRNGVPVAITQGGGVRMFPPTYLEPGPTNPTGEPGQTPPIYLPPLQAVEYTETPAPIRPIPYGAQPPVSFWGPGTGKGGFLKD